jgi:hypothetical protein
MSEYDYGEPTVPSGPGRFGNLAELATALAKAQSEIEDATKDATNPHFKSRYADLASVRAAIRKPLSDNGIAYVQLARAAEKSVEIETILIHGKSGQAIGDTLRLPLQQATPQAVGSAISYGRRYSLMSIVGIAADDDDGETAARGIPSNTAARNGAAPKRTMKEISANKVRKEGDYKSVLEDIAQIESIAALERYAAEVLTPDFLAGMGAYQFQVEELLARRRAELSQPDSNSIESKGDYVRWAHEIIDNAPTYASLAAWWQTETAARTRFRLSAEEIQNLKDRCAARKRELEAEAPHGRDKAGRPLQLTEAG